MKFVTNPQLILTTEEFKTLNGALQLCQDMDNMTTANSCQSCPFVDNCTCKVADCVYSQAYQALKKIMGISVIK